MYPFLGLQVPLPQRAAFFQLVYHERVVTTVEELKQRIENACDVFRGYFDFIFDVTVTMST